MTHTYEAHMARVVNRTYDVTRYRHRMIRMAKGKRRFWHMREGQKLAEILNDPATIEYCIAPSEELQLAAIALNPYVLDLAEDQIETAQIKSVKTSDQFTILTVQSPVSPRVHAAHVRTYGIPNPQLHKLMSDNPLDLPSIAAIYGHGTKEYLPMTDWYRL
ncbi:hypothetical protein WEU32_06765 [Brevundimonas sp. BH3]|uniref:hypothetical protein n=1 Tax=Brevundimonas sp. BH3 TaxID=3133089 RepID=UPI003253C8C4